MIFKCTKCGEEIHLDRRAKYCPFCAGELERVDVNARVTELYNEGKSNREISSTLHLSALTVDQLIARAMADGDISPEGMVQEEYEDDIMDIINNNWDGRAKTIKESVSPDCTYTTIQYYIEKERNKRRARTAGKVEEIREMAKEGREPEEIAKELRVSNFLVERILVEECEADDDTADLYINPKYHEDVVETAERLGTDDVRVLKENLPEELTYMNIKASLAKAGK